MLNISDQIDQYKDQLEADRTFGIAQEAIDSAAEREHRAKVAKHQREIAAVEQMKREAEERLAHTLAQRAIETPAAVAGELRAFLAEPKPPTQHAPGYIELIEEVRHLRRYLDFIVRYIDANERAR